jgi:hypothetical protein
LAGTDKVVIANNWGGLIYILVPKVRQPHVAHNVADLKRPRRVSQWLASAGPLQAATASMF